MTGTSATFPGYVLFCDRQKGYFIPDRCYAMIEIMTGITVFFLMETTVVLWL